MSSTILWAGSHTPPWPPTSQNPDAKRATVNGFVVDYLGDTPTTQEVTAFMASAAPRLALDIIADINALTGAQKNLIWTDITSGTPPKWQLDAGPNAGAIAAMASTLKILVPTFVPASNADVVNTKIWAVALYVQDHPTYLVHPSFDPSINISGTA